MRKIDTGIDDNIDSHCDNCGWFVDRYGQHQARAVLQNTNEEIQFSWTDEDLRLETIQFDSFVREFYEGNPYNMYTNPSFRLWPLIYKYSLNDPRDHLSCPSLNDFLRNGTVNPNSDSLELMDTVLSMNFAISKFRLKKTLVTYRGMSFDAKNDFVEMLDKASISLKKAKVFPFTDKGFVSTSRDVDYAKTVMMKNEKDVYVLCAYVSLPGAQCMPLSQEWKTTQDDSEKEVLFKAMEEYYICSLQKLQKGKYRFYNCIILNSKEKIHD